MGSVGVEAARKPMWLYPKVLGFNPPERWGHSACYSNGFLYVFGGCCGGLHFSDVLMLNLNTMVWSTLVTTGKGPGPRDSHSAVLVGNRMLVFGGTNGSKKVNDLHVLDISSKEWIQPECKGAAPCARESHTATLIGGDKLVIFGGSGEGEANYLNDLHVLDLRTMEWTSPPVKGEIPVPRDSHSAVAVGNKLVVYGGDRGDRYHGGIEVFDLNKLSWSKMAVQGVSPGVRAGHAAVNFGTKIFVIGGVGDKHYYNDIWALDVATCSWSRQDICGQQPQGRFSHTAIVVESDIITYGGCGEDERPLNELLVLQLGADHPNGRYNVSMCKNFGNHWIQEGRKFPSGEESNPKTFPVGDKAVTRKRSHEPEQEPKQNFQIASDALHLKRRNCIPKAWEVESEQEEHSLSLSQHSSPSQSDQEQFPARKVNGSTTGPRGLNLFKQFRQCPSNEAENAANNNHKQSRCTPHVIRQEMQFPHPMHRGREEMQHPSTELRQLEQWPSQNMSGREVMGRVDGVFDSGLLMTATVNGHIFRGVLFAPGPGVVARAVMAAQNPVSTNQMAVPQPFPDSSYVHESSRPYQQQAVTIAMKDPKYSFQQCRPPYQEGRVGGAVKEPPKLRSDLQDVVLTLGGLGSGHA